MAGSPRSLAAEMIRSRWAALSALGRTTSPPRESRREGFDALLDLGSVVRVHGAYFEAKYRCVCLDRPYVSCPGRIIWRVNDSYPRNVRSNLLEQFQPFYSERVLIVSEPGGGPSRPREACDNSATNRIGKLHEHNRNRVRFSL